MTLLAQSHNVNPLIVLERSKCYGTCPVYKVTIYKDGSLLYKGIEYVKSKGEISSKITSEQVQKLVDEIKKAKYFTLRNSYANSKDGCIAMYSDSFWTYTTIQINKKKKSVKHYLGCNSGGEKFDKELKRLTEFENKIVDIIKIEQWIGTEEERSNFRFREKIDIEPQGIH